MNSSWHSRDLPFGSSSRCCFPASRGSWSCGSCTPISLLFKALGLSDWNTIHTLYHGARTLYPEESVGAFLEDTAKASNLPDLPLNVPPTFGSSLSFCFCIPGLTLLSPILWIYTPTHVTTTDQDRIFIAPWKAPLYFLPVNTYPSTIATILVSFAWFWTSDQWN